MVTLSMKASESGNFVVFRALAESSRFQEALERVEQYNTKHPDRRVLGTPRLKKAMEEAFKQMKAVMKKAFPNVEKLDLDDSQVVDRLHHVLCQHLPKDSFKELGRYEGLSMRQANIGHILVTYSESIDKFGKGYFAEQKRASERIEHEQVTVNRHRRLGQSYASGMVFSNKNTYKTSREAVVARMLEEKRKGRA
ncbi:MAG: hypothetical protein NC218_06880 [Acetobacter sp.]|nr:hypothetical protein [Acetobacter sp.]